MASPTRPCPNCGKPVHIRARSHKCGWNAAAPAKATKTRPRKASADLSLEDITTVKGLVERLGAKQLKELAGVFE